MLATARRLQDTDGFQGLLVLYARSLAEEKQFVQLRRICNGLASVPSAPLEDKRLVSCPGVDPKDLLRKVLTMLTSQPACSTLAEEFQEVSLLLDTRFLSCLVYVVTTNVPVPVVLADG
jgi:hypothetical protein